MPHGVNQQRAARWFKQLVVGGNNLGAATPPLHIIPQASAPTGASEGSVYYSSVSKGLVVNNGTGNVAVGSSATPVAVTATADGTGTGTIAAGTSWAQVTSANADHIVVLPAPSPGTVVTLMNAATGYELRSSAPATVGINGGTGAAAESAIGALTLVQCRCSVATNWVCTSFAAAGTVTATQVAAP